MTTTKLAAVDPADARGKKAVIFVSPGWFIAPVLDAPGFGANFSPLHGGVFAFDSRLSPSLKQDIARRLLDYPGIMVLYPLLKAGMSCLAANTGPQRALLAALRPLAAVQYRVQRELDYARLGVWWWQEGTRVTPRLAPPARLGADRLGRPAAGCHGDLTNARRRSHRTAWHRAAGSTRTGSACSIDPGHPEYSPDANFTRWCARSKEWTDYRLMLRTANGRWGST